MPVRAIEYESATVTVTVGATLTLRDVTLIRDALARGPPGSQLVIDFRDAVSVEVAVLETLGKALSDSGTRGRFLGLTFSNARLLGQPGSDPSMTGTVEGHPGEDS